MRPAFLMFLKLNSISTKINPLTMPKNSLMNFLSPINYMNPKTIPLILVLACAAPGVSQAQSTWNQTVNADWNTSTNWTPNGVPNAAGAVVNLTNSIPGSRTVNLNVDATVGIINIGDTDATPHAFTLSNATNTLTFNSGNASAAQLNYLAGSVTNLVGPAKLLATSLDISNNSNVSQTFTGTTGSSTSGTKILRNAGSGTGEVTFATGAVISNATGTIAVVQDSATSRMAFANTVNTYSGGFTLQQGTVAISGGSSAVLGSGTLTLVSGRVEKTTDTGRTLTNNYGIQGNIEFDSVSGSNNRIILNGAGDLNGATRTLTVNTNAALLIGGALGNGGVTKAGAGVLEYSTAKAYTGATTISAGTLILSTTGNFASTTLGFGVVDASAGILRVDNTAFTFTGTMNLNLSAVTVSFGSWNLFTGSAFGSGDVNLANLISNIGGLTFTESANIWSGASAGRTWSFAEATGQLSVVPEPSTWMLLAMGLVLVSLRRRASFRA